MTNARMIDASTRLCAVIGNPIEHSLSPAIHNAAFEAVGLNYVYVAFNVEDIGAAVGGFRALGNVRGLSVTIPHKVSIMQHLDDIDDMARNTGSVNTVVKDGSLLKGSSSDGPGALKALVDYGVGLEGRSVLILGSGGAARAVAFALAMAERPPAISVLGVVPEELQTLVNDLKEKTSAHIQEGRLDEDSLRDSVGKADIIIHCTPVGMHPKTEGTLVPKSLLRPEHTVFDIVYTPRATRLLTEAQDVGCRTIPGLEMFVNQAVIQFELWTGRQAPVEVMRQIVAERLQ
jgi:shikimate dehydrogenase